MSKKCAKFLFRIDSKQNSYSFFYFARCFVTEFCMFLFRRNRRNFYETTVCFVFFHLSRNNFFNKKCKGKKLILTILFLASTEVFFIFLSFFSCASYSKQQQLLKTFPLSNAKKIIIYSLYFMLTSATTKYPLLGTYGMSLIVFAVCTTVVTLLCRF